MKIIQNILILLFISTSDLVACDIGLTDVGGTCYHTADLDALVAIATNSGMGSEYADVIEMGGQSWDTNGRLTYWDGGIWPLNTTSYRLSGSIPSDIGNLTELVTLDMGNSAGTSSIYASNLESDYTNCEFLFGDQNFSIIQGGGTCMQDCAAGYVAITSDVGYLPPDFDPNTGDGLDNFDLCSSWNLQCCISESEAAYNLYSIDLCNTVSPPSYDGCLIEGIQYCDNSENCIYGTTNFVPCDVDQTDVGGTCYNTSDLDVLVAFAENSGMGSEYGDVIGMGQIQTWDNGRLDYFMCGFCGLSGSIPSEIGNLTALKKLELYSNDLTGAIPPEIGDLTELLHLNLSGNNLAGSIPPEMGSLTNLEQLKLDQNVLEGTIPTEIWSLVNLEFLWLYENVNLTGTIPSVIGNLTNLKHLWLATNSFTGSIPYEIGNLTELELLYLNDNNFTGAIPASFCNFSNLVNFNISDNDLCPYYPACLTLDIGTQNTSSCPECESDEIAANGTDCYSQNDLDALVAFATNSGMGSEYGDVINMGSQTWDGEGRLTDWDCENCGLSGSIPSEIGNLKKLTYLHLASNDLTGNIPTEIGSLTELSTLNLASNDLTGNIPTEIGSLTELSTLNLASNDLITGNIPIEIGSLTELTYLGLNNNDLTGNIPTEIGSLTELSTLNLANNDLTGNIPTEIGSLTELTYLYLYGNDLTGNIPIEIGSLTELTYLHLANNDLTGNIPTEIGSLTELTTLNLFNNDLTGNIPTEIGSLTELTYLGLNNNDLTGNIPTEIGSLTELTYLYLYGNELTGLIPNSFCNFPDGIFLMLDDNKFCLPYPTCLTAEQIGSQNTNSCPTCESDGISVDGTDCYSQNDLDVLVAFATNSGMGSEYGDVINMGSQTWDGEGRLTDWDCENCGLIGEIPPNIGNLIELSYLNISSNGLDGSIPISIGNLINLEGLLLDSNKLEDSIPSGIGNLTELMFLDISKNELAGSIPISIGNLTDLTYLDLAANELTGTIPSEIGSLTELVYLNISENELEDSIPIVIGNLTNLQWLALFDNQLEGSIPSEIGSLTELIELLLYDNDLTGTIPSEIGSLIKLTVLYLSSNEFYGLIPDSFCNLPEGIDLDLDNNDLCPPYPDCLTAGQIGSQNTINCPDCTVEETAVYEPAEDVGCYNNGDLEFLQDLIDNSAQVPTDLDPLILGHQSWQDNRLQTFCCSSIDLTQFSFFSGLGDCQTECQYEFSTTIPQSIGNLAALETLALAGMGLLGSIPDTLSTLTDLDVLILDNNNLSGNIPDNIGNITGLQHLSLQNNNLNGEIPSSLWDLTELRSLVLSNNQISDTLSTNINMSSFSLDLQWFDISGNDFYGLIPEYFCDMSLISSLSQQFIFYDNTFCPPYPECIDQPMPQGVELVSVYQDLNENGQGNPLEMCSEQYCADYLPQTGVCEGYVADNSDSSDGCDDGLVHDECFLCGGDGYAEACINTDDCVNMDCAGTCGGDAALDLCGICSGGASGHDENDDFDQCNICFGPNTNCDHTNWGVVGGTCPNKDQYCGNCDGIISDCLAQLNSIMYANWSDAGSMTFNILENNFASQTYTHTLENNFYINAQTLQFHFSVPIDYSGNDDNTGIKIESDKGEDYEFYTPFVEQDSILQLTLKKPLISNDEITIILTPSRIRNFSPEDFLPAGGGYYFLDSDKNGPNGNNGTDEEDLVIATNVTLLGDYDNSNAVDGDDLAILLDVWGTEDFSYELGPWEWGATELLYKKAPWLQQVAFDDVHNYDIHDLIAFALMWNWNYSENFLFREIQSEPTIHYVPEYNFENNQMTLNLENFPGEIKMLSFQLNVGSADIELENALKSSKFDIKLHGSHAEYGIYDWVLGSISPRANNSIDLFNIISSTNGHAQHLKLAYEIIGFDQEISSGEIDFTYQTVPGKITISPPYPNPFNPVMSIEYGIPKKSNALIEIYNIQGRLVNKTVKSDMEAGYYTFTWDGSNQSSGIYLIRMKISDTIKNYRTLLIK